VTASAVTTRDRILDAALVLTARKGAAGTSMRELADACDVNVAALYYHFPSKADLLRAVIEERRYDLQMGLVEVPSPSSGSDAERLARLLVEVWHGMQREEQVWRLLLAESAHHNSDAQEVAASLVGQFEDLARHWFDAAFEHLRVGPEVAAKLVADFLFASVVRTVIAATDDTQVEDRAAALAEVIAGA